MLRRIGSFNLIVFSDDNEFASKLFKNIDHRLFDAEVDPIQLLTIMSSCDHFIVSNSTFSYWAALIADSPSKQVICPSNWFVGTPTDDLDLVPSSWIKI